MRDSGERIGEALASAIPFVRTGSRIERDKDLKPITSLDRRTVGRWESGELSPTLNSLALLAHGANLSLAGFLRYIAAELDGEELTAPTIDMAIAHDEEFTPEQRAYLRQTVDLLRSEKPSGTAR